MSLIDTMVERWSSPEARPLFKGSLIDDDGCCCAQGDVLRVCGMTDQQLRDIDQDNADREVANKLGISLAHSILLRHVNDDADGCPQDVLAHPERVLGDQASRILTFWRRLDVMAPAQWAAAGTAAEAAARIVAEAAARIAAVATNEIQGAAQLERFFFLPCFGISHPRELDD